jgi:tetratricopeptide (TPR) repeat protein
MIKILLIILFANNLFSQAGDSEKYSELRSLLDSGDLQVAEETIESLLAKDPGEPKLTLYQTEIWIEKANRFYDQRKFKSAFALYEKAYKNWNSHPVVRKRYFELKDRRLVDYGVPANSFSNPRNKSENEQLDSTQRENDLKWVFKSQEEKISELNQKLETIYYRSTLGLGILIGLNIAMLLVFLWKSKK